MSFQPQGQGPPTLTRGLLESETELHELFAKFVFVVPVSSTQGFLSLLLCWVSFAFSFHHMSFQQVGLLLGLVSTSLGPSWGCFSQVTFETWHPHVRGVYNFLGSVSLQQRFEIADQCYSSVIAQSFFLQTKAWGSASPKGESSISASSFYTFVSSPPWACPMHVGLAKEGHVFFTWSSHFSPQIFACSIFAVFSVCLLATTILESFFLF